MAEDFKHPPLDTGERWRHRWYHLGDGRLIHRVSEIDEPEDEPRGPGVAVCGRRGFLSMPGIFSRMGAARCRDCCRALGLPPGEGAPYNDKTMPDEQRDA